MIWCRCTNASSIWIRLVVTWSFFCL